MRSGAFPVISPYGGKFSREMLPLLLNQTELQLENGYQTLTVAGPAPGHSYSMLASHNTCYHHDMVVAAKAVYRIEENVITIVPSYHNYQDIRTLFSVTSGARQTFRFAVPEDAWRTEITISKCQVVGGPASPSSCPVLLAASPVTIPRSVCSLLITIIVCIAN